MDQRRVFGEKFQKEVPGHQEGHVKLARYEPKSRKTAGSQKEGGRDLSPLTEISKSLSGCGKECLWGDQR